MGYQMVLTQYRRVTDGRTDRRTDEHVAIAITRASICMNVKVTMLDMFHVVIHFGTNRFLIYEIDWYQNE